MPGIKELKTRIKSIGSTRKITLAMQMVSAAKMRKAQSAVVQSRNYASMAWELIENVAKQGVFEHPLVKVYPKANKIGAILLTSNKGLVGSLNINLMSKLKEISSLPINGQTTKTEIIAELITYGKKAKTIAARMNKTILADFSKQDGTITTGDIYPIAKFVSDTYKTGGYKKIVVVYNHFVSTIQQKPSTRQLLPFSSIYG
ncbi:MAG: F0F1 ATP synthase subunit gamma [Candidatus Doudnabacteria bacterium]|nr:F0F1 ATP synthase subunit gamma [Candidatus Doudnabacteria bacterium]